MRSIERIVLVHRLREVVAQVGFTRFEAPTQPVDAEVALGVRLASLALDVRWLPAVENRGEGVFLALDPAKVGDWLTRKAVKERSERFRRGLPGAEKREIPEAVVCDVYMPYILLHSLSHLLLTAVSLDVRGSRDTAVVAQELFRSAERSVVLSTFSVGHRHEEGEPLGHPVLRPLAERMAAKPGLHVRLFLNIKRMAWQSTASETQIVGEFSRWFRSQLWPWQPTPELYFDPRSLEGGDESACLHAKCIVVDDEHAFVTSANLTEAAQVRNIEAGVLLQNAVFAKELRLQFEALINRGLLRRVSLSNAASR